MTMTNGNKYIAFKCADERNCVAYVSAWQIEKLTPYIKTGTIESNMLSNQQISIFETADCKKSGRDCSI